MKTEDTLLLSRMDVAGLLTIDECMLAVENVFRLYAEEKVSPPKVLGMHTKKGGFHIKAGILETGRTYFAAKLNANFPGNPKQNGLPSIQGVIALCDGNNGRLLALTDSIEITIIRTGAATGIAAKYLAVDDAKIATICGCGNQGRISLQALMKVRKLEKVYMFDIDKKQAEILGEEFSQELQTIPITLNELQDSLGKSQICVTCTPASIPFIHIGDVMPGTFIAAVGADCEEKQELFADLTASAKVVADIAEQSIAIGELHHAIKQGLMTCSDIHAELGEIISGKKPGRESDKEIIIFDSTGTALQDVAAAAIVYEKAIQSGVGGKLILSQEESEYEILKKTKEILRH